MCARTCVTRLRFKTRCSVLQQQRVAMCCRVQSAAASCSVLQCVAVCRRLVRWFLNVRSIYMYIHILYTCIYTYICIYIHILYILLRWRLNFRSRISRVWERIFVVLIVQTSRTCKMRKCVSFFNIADFWDAILYESRCILMIRSCVESGFINEVALMLRWWYAQYMRFDTPQNTWWNTLYNKCDMIHHTTRDEIHYTIHVITTTWVANTRHVFSRSVFFQIW